MLKSEVLELKMASLKDHAVRALKYLIDNSFHAEGWYLKPSAYKQTKDDIDEIIEQSAESNDTLALLVEAALAADDATLFSALYEHAGWDMFIHVVDDYFGLCGFFVYCSPSCLTVYLDLQLEEPEAWAETCDQRLFDELEKEFWQLDWAPKWRGNPLAILYLLHFKGGIRATSLLKKCIQHGFTAFYAPLRALGARFEVDDLYSADHAKKDLCTLLEAGLLDELAVSATQEDWVYLLKTLLE